MAGAAARSGLRALSHRLMKNTDTNLVFSPLSISSSLALIAAGAGGSTLEELQAVFGARCREGLVEETMVDRAMSPYQGGPQTYHGAGVWHDASRKVNMDHSAAYDGYAAVGALDFVNRPEVARARINAWLVSTAGGSILAPGSVDKDTRLLHTSAFSLLHASWVRPFHKWRNKRGKFRRLDGSAVDADFMHSYHRDQFIATHDGFKVLKMPYTVYDPFDAVQDSVATCGDPYYRDLFALARARKLPPSPPHPRYSMCVFLPDASGGLPDLEDRIFMSGEGFVLDHLPRRRVEAGELRVPKFKLSFSASLKPVLQGLGVRAAFAAEADMSGMLDRADDSGEPLYVNDMLHKAEVEVGEEGTREADPAPCSMCGACLWPEPRSGCADFVADHPFAFFVVEELSGAILLAGHVLHPVLDQDNSSFSEPIWDGSL